MKLIFQDTHPQQGNASSFTFKPVEPLSWVAGQSIKIEVPGPYGPIEHRFTISSAPYENVITITTRLSGSDYKNSLKALRLGDQVDAYAIEGDFIWHENSQPHTFVAAGIGITPFNSIIKQRLHSKLSIPAKLIYCSTQGFVFKNELDRWHQTNPEFRVNYIDGRLDIKHIPKTDGLIYLSGPSILVDAISNELVKRGIPQISLIRDLFTGRLSG